MYHWAVFCGPALALVCTRHACERKHSCCHAGRKGACEHVAAWPGDAPGMTDAAFEEQMSKFFDPDTGRKRLTCVSRQRIPEDLKGGERCNDWAGVHDFVFLSATTFCLLSEFVAC
jgi:hypothetical protein